MVLEGENWAQCRDVLSRCDDLAAGDEVELKEVLQSFAQLPSAQLGSLHALKCFEKGTSVLLGKLNARQATTPVIPPMLEVLVTAIKTGVSLTNTLDLTDLPQLINALINIFSSFSNRFAETELLPGTELSFLCHVVELVQSALNLSHHALFDKRWFEILGSHDFKSCNSTVRCAVKNLIGFTHQLVCLIWTGMEAYSEPPDEDLDKLKSLISILVKDVLHLGVTAADAMLESSGFPREMMSLANVNMAWGALIKWLTALPGSALVMFDEAIITSVIDHTANYLRQELLHFLDPAAAYDANKLKVIRFWTQVLTKVVGTHVLCASRCWSRLFSLSLSVYEYMAERSESERSHQVFIDLEQHLAPKLVQLLMMCLEEEGHESGLAVEEARLESIMRKMSAFLPCAEKSNGSGITVLPPSQKMKTSASQNSTFARVFLCSAMLHRVPLFSSSIGLLAMARNIVPWVIKAVTEELYSVCSLKSHTRGGALEMVCSGILVLVATCNNFTYQGAGSHDEVAEQASKECLSLLYNLGCSSTHPSLQQFSCITLSCLASISTEEAASSQLLELGSLISEFSYAEAVIALGALLQDTSNEGTKADSLRVFKMSPESAAVRASRLMGCLMQAAPLNAVMEAYHKLHLEPSAYCLELTSDIGSAISTALICHSFQMTVVSRTVNVSLWLRSLSKRVIQLSEVLQLTEAEGPEVHAIASLHLAAVLLVLDVHSHRSEQLQSEGIDENAAAGLASATAAAASAAAEVLQSWHSLRLFGSLKSESHIMPPHLDSALRVLSRIGCNLSAPVLSDLEAVFLLMVQDYPSSTAAVATVASHFHLLNPLPSKLFHHLLRQGHWAVIHEALTSMLRISKSQAAGDFRVLIPQELFVSSSTCGDQAQDSGHAISSPLLFKYGRAYKEYLFGSTMPHKLDELISIHSESESGGWDLSAISNSEEISIMPVSAKMFLLGLQGLESCVAGCVSSSAMTRSSSTELLQLLAQNKNYLESMSKTLGLFDTYIGRIKEAKASRSLCTIKEGSRGHDQSLSHLNSELSSMLEVLTSYVSSVQSVQRKCELLLQ